MWTIPASRDSDGFFSGAGSWVFSLSINLPSIGCGAEIALPNVVALIVERAEPGILDTFQVLIESVEKKN